MSVWIKLDADYPSHPKTLRLCRLLGDGADAYPIRLWTWCARFAKDGKPDVSFIEEACRWKGETGALIHALKSVGFLDSDGSVHDWDEWTGAFLRELESRREAARKAMKSKRKRERNVNATLCERDANVSRMFAHREDKSREEEKRGEKTPSENGDPSDLSGRPADDPGGSSSKSSADPEKRRRAEAIERVFAHYLTVWPKSSRYTLTPDRRAKIAARLKSFSEDELKEALTKSGTDDWPERPKYADIEKLLPNDGAVERWLNFTPKVQPVEKDPLDDGWMEWAAEQQRALHEPGPGESER